MRIEIYVVMSELGSTEDDKRRIELLDRCRYDLVTLCGGLTQITPIRGWCLERGKHVVDEGILWIIYPRNIEIIHESRFKLLLLDIKNQTKQKALMYTVNNEMFTI